MSAKQVHIAVGKVIHRQSKTIVLLFFRRLSQPPSSSHSWLAAFVCKISDNPANGQIMQIEISGIRPILHMTNPLGTTATFLLSIVVVFLFLI